MNIPEIIRQAHREAVKVRLNSYSPYSRFKVGAAIISSKNNIYSGTNVENSCYTGICAERCAIFEAVKNADFDIQHVVVATDAVELSPPCGFCRQVIAEFMMDDTKVWLGDLQGVREMHVFAEIFPKSFTRKNLTNLAAD